eukprot:15550-Heterococcus_DN1.PRE.10
MTSVTTAAAAADATAVTALVASQTVSSRTHLNQQASQLLMLLLVVASYCYVTTAHVNKVYAVQSVTENSYISSDDV